MSDEMLWGYKQIAARLGCSERALADKMALPVDPIRPNRLCGKRWMLASEVDTWKRRHDPATRGAEPMAEGWEAIAKALQTSVRSAKRWAALSVDPLPVERRCGGVVAYKAALQSWLDGQNQRPAVLRGGPTKREDVCPPKRKVRAA